MSKKVLVLILVLFIGSSSIVSAQTYETVNGSTTAETTDLKKMPAQKLMTRPSVGNVRPGTKAAELIQSKMQMFRDKIQNIQDARKKMIVEKISTNITSRNTSATTKMSNALSRMTSILTDFQSKAAALKAAGNDTTNLDSALSAAQEAIASAQALVTEQAQSEYTAAITTDATLKTPIGQMVSDFTQDISAVHKAVVAAKQALMKAVTELAKLRGVGTPAATESANL